MRHVKPVDISSIIIEASDLENESALDLYERRVQSAYRNVWEATPSIVIDVEAIATALTNREHPQTHVQHQVSYTSSHDNLIATGDGSVSKSALRHRSFLENQASLVLKFYCLIACRPVLDDAATEEEYMHVGLAFLTRPNIITLIYSNGCAPADVVEGKGLFSAAHLATFELRKFELSSPLEGSPELAARQILRIAL